MNILFRDRSDGGRFLADRLRHYEKHSDVLVLALPRGGVPVAAEIANRLEAPLDVFVVRKLGAPGHEEFAFGALATGGVRFLNEDVVRYLGLTDAMVDAITEEQQMELEHRERLCRGERPPAEIRGRRVILVDDGLATGASMQAAVRALRRHQPRSITVAVPVGARETCQAFESEVDEVICGRTPPSFQAVGQWYEDFRQTTDEAVAEILNHHAHELKARHVERRHGNTAQIG